MRNKDAGVAFLARGERVCKVRLGSAGGLLGWVMRGAEPAACSLLASAVRAGSSRLVGYLPAAWSNSCRRRNDLPPCPASTPALPVHPPNAPICLLVPSPRESPCMENPYGAHWGWGCAPQGMLG